MKVGITGTKDGATEGQLIALRKELLRIGPTELHHGDCVGVDEQAHKIAEKLGILTIIHPPRNDRLRAYCDGDVILEADEYLARNKAIVHSVHLLIVVPKTNQMQLRSGTWSTYRYALRREIEILLIYTTGIVWAVNIKG